MSTYSLGLAILTNVLSPLTLFSTAAVMEHSISLSLSTHTHTHTHTHTLTKRLSKVLQSILEGSHELRGMWYQVFHTVRATSHHSLRVGSQASCVHGDDGIVLRASTDGGIEGRAGGVAGGGGGLGTHPI